MFTYRTIRTGQRVAVWDKKTGDVAYVSGPKRLLLWNKTVEDLERYAAGADEYLVITFRDGHAEHLRGPAAVWFHPVEHANIDLEKALPLDAHEVLVVYKRELDRITRRLVRGPELFVPAADEWLHEFSWHGADPANPSRKVPRALRFNKLRVIPDQMYYDVADVRTADDALLVVQLMVFFELADVETMLQQTHDPIADFVNDVTADIIDFAAALPFEAFKEQTEKLNNLATYPQLTTRAQRIGYRINKVVYRGYHASTKLQAMHDNAIETRTRLKLEAETERQAQELADMKLQCEAERAERLQQMQAQELQHRNRLNQMEHEQQMKLQQAELERHLDAQRRKADVSLETERRRNELVLEHRRAMHAERGESLKQMQEMQVDLTRYLVARYRHPDRLIRIENDGEANGAGKGNNRAQLHLHD